MRGLCLSGGALRGYCQIPVLAHLLQEHDYDFIYGTSIGAMNGVMVAQGKFQELRAIWETINSHNNILKLQWWWPFQGLYSLKPMRDRMNEHVFLEDIKIPFAAGVVSLTDGQYYNLSTHNMTTDNELRDAVLASSSISGYMRLPTIKINGKKHVGTDGGFRNYTPVPPPNHYTHLDIITCSPLDSIAPRHDLEKDGVKQVIRSLEIMQDEIFARDIEEIRCRSDKDINIRVFAPPADTGPSFKITPELKKLRWGLGIKAYQNPIYL